MTKNLKHKKALVRPARWLSVTVRTLDIANINKQFFAFTGRVESTEQIPVGVGCAKSGIKRARGKTAEDRENAI